MRRREIGLLFGVVSSLVTLAPTIQGQSVDLDRVNRLVEEGRFEEGRTVLETWLDRSWEGAVRAERERGLWLRALLTIDPTLAELDYRRLVVEYPGGRFSDQALLRLARSAEAQRDLDASRRYLEILVRDYPQSPERIEARTMLARLPEGANPSSAQASSPDQDAATPRTDAATRAATVDPPGLAAAVPETPAPDQAAAPEAAPVPEAPAAPEARSASETRSVPDAASVQDPVQATSPFTLQLGAFSSADRARALAGDARIAAFDLRIVQVEGSPLVRVRTGAFETPEEAEIVREELRRAGIQAIVSTDRGGETPVR